MKNRNKEKINGGHRFTEMKIQKMCLVMFVIHVDWNLARYLGKTYCVWKCKKIDTIIENLVIEALWECNHCLEDSLLMMWLHAPFYPLGSSWTRHKIHVSSRYHIQDKSVKEIIKILYVINFTEADGHLVCILFLSQACLHICVQNVQKIALPHKELFTFLSCNVVASELIVRKVLLIITA